MALKVKAVERKIKFNKNDEGVWRYVMQPEPGWYGSHHA